jgi:hypothetical protein
MSEIILIELEEDAWKTRDEKLVKEAIREEYLDEIRRQLALQQIVLRPDEILLNKVGLGLGKSVTTGIVQLGDENTQAVFLCPRQEQATELRERIEQLLNKPLPQIRGLKQKINSTYFCDDKDLRDGKFADYYIDESIRCHNCQHNCLYKQQFNQIAHGESWFGVHHHLNTKIVKKSFENSTKQEKVLIIDENPLNAFGRKIEIDKSDLQKFEDLIRDVMWLENAPEVLSNFALAVIYVTRCFEDILDDTNKGNEFDGYSFVDKLKLKLKSKKRIDVNLLYDYVVDSQGGIKNTYTSDDKDGEGESLDTIHEMLQRTNRNGILHKKIFKHFYVQRMNKIFNGDENLWVKNLLDFIVEITELCFEYDKNRKPNDINLPFYTLYTEVFEKNRKHISKTLVSDMLDFEKIKDNLPEGVPIIINDGTTPTEIYELFAKKLGKELRVFQPPLPDYERNIIQFMDGNFYKTTLENDYSWKKIVDFVVMLTKKHPNEKRINIVIAKEFENKLKQSLSGRVRRSKINIIHFGNVRGLIGLEKDKVMIIIGIPEPNSKLFSKEVGRWYEGEAKISIERREEPDKIPYYYLDDRYRPFVESIRENEIEQVIERLRFFLPPEGKVCYLICKLPISFETKKTTISNYELDDKILKTLQNHPTGLLTKELFKLVDGRSNNFYSRLKELQIFGRIQRVKIEATTKPMFGYQWKR